MNIDLLKHFKYFRGCVVNIYGGESTIARDFRNTIDGEELQRHIREAIETINNGN